MKLFQPLLALVASASAVSFFEVEWPDFVIRSPDYLQILLDLVTKLTKSGHSFFEVVAEEWEAWKYLHGKRYTDASEEKFRMKIFMNNKAKIAKHNAG